MTETVTTAGGDASAAPGVPAPRPAPPAGSNLALSPAQFQAMAPAVVETVTSHPGVSPSAAMNTAATVLDTLAQFMGPIFQVSRANPRQQAEVALSVAMLETLLHAFRRPPNG
jgi:hypothetical protein